MNNDIRELNIGEVEAVSGGAKTKVPTAMDAANSIDLSDFLAGLDKAIALAKEPTNSYLPPS